MNCHDYQRLLGDYIDGTLDAAGVTALEAHLARCSRCGSAAHDSEAIRLMAQTLEPHTPPPQVWQRIAAATAPPYRERTSPMPLALWQLAASAALLLLTTAGLWWVGDRLASAAARPGAEFTLATPGAVPPLTPARQDAEVRYTSAIATLQEITTAERVVLDPGTAAALDSGITVIDHAIAESRAALDTNPDSEIAQESLFQALRRKVALLQQMLALINEMRKGNQDAAARILSELN